MENKPTKNESPTILLSQVSASPKHPSGQVLAACPRRQVHFCSGSNRRPSRTLSD